jgi:hypothetical protein
VDLRYFITSVDESLRRMGFLFWGRVWHFANLFGTSYQHTAAEDERDERDRRTKKKIFDKKHKHPTKPKI